MNTLFLAPMEGLGDRPFRKALASIGGFDEDEIYFVICAYLNLQFIEHSAEKFCAHRNGETIAFRNQHTGLLNSSFRNQFFSECISRSKFYYFMAKQYSFYFPHTVQITTFCFLRSGCEEEEREKKNKSRFHFSEWMIGLRL